MARPEFQYSFKRALIATALVAGGVAMLPIARGLTDPPPLSVAYLIVACAMGLPMTGYGVLIGRPVLCGALGFAVGVVSCYFRQML